METVSGGNHPGLMHIKQTGNDFEVTTFDAVEDGADNMSSAMKIFGMNTLKHCLRKEKQEVRTGLILRAKYLLS